MLNQDMQPIKLSDSLYQLGTPKFPVYLSMGREGMLIEGGTTPTADIIADQIDYLGIEPERIRYMALTHTHADHIGAVPRLRRRWPHLKIAASVKAADFLSGPKMVEQFLPTDRMINKIFVAGGIIDAMPEPLDEYRFEADMVLADGDSIDLGDGVRWTAYNTPGHSACHMSYFEEKEGVLAAGDMTGYFDPGLDIFWPNYFSGLADYTASILRMAALPSQTVLLSHNGAISGWADSFMLRALTATQEYHHQLLGQLSCGEDEERLCVEKAEWVYGFAPIASPKAIEFLCHALCKQSRKAGADQIIAPMWGALSGKAASGLKPTGTSGA